MNGRVIPFIEWNYGVHWNIYLLRLARNLKKFLVNWLFYCRLKIEVNENLFEIGFWLIMDWMDFIIYGRVNCFIYDKR